MERVNGLIIFLLGLVILWQGRGLSLGNLHQPGPGFFPLVIAGVLIVLSVPIFLTARARAEGETGFSRRGLGRIVTVFAALIGYFLLLEYLGFAAVSFLLMTFFFLFIARQRWYAALFWALVTTGLAYLLFETLLQSNLPKGILRF